MGDEVDRATWVTPSGSRPFGVASNASSKPPEDLASLASLALGGSSLVAKRVSTHTNHFPCPAHSATNWMPPGSPENTMAQAIPTSDIGIR